MAHDAYWYVLITLRGLWFSRHLRTRLPVVAHALVTHLICPFSTPRVILSDKGAEFRNAVVSENCSQFRIKQTFTTTYHPASNGLVERANRKILEVLRPIVNELSDNWEDWLPHVAASLNSSVNDSTGKSPHYILYGVENVHLMTY